MTKITKIFAVIASSLLVSFASVAGELTVSGSANASYLINGGVQNNNGKGIGISNELKFAASGELDNGYSWNYHMELDPNGGGTTDNDDTALTINTGGMGTIGIFDSEGGLSTELGYGIGAIGVGLDYANSMASSGHTAMNWGLDVSSHPNVQYHLPADILPLGLGAKVGYAPNTGDGDSNSYKNSGATAAQGPTGDALLQYQLTAAPIDGLKIGADYFNTDESLTRKQPLQSGNAYAQYAMGNFKVGYNVGGYSVPLTAKNGAKTRYENEAFGIEFAVNDALTVSYNEEKSEAFTNVAIVAGASGGVKTSVESDVESWQVAYVMGGATLGLSIADTGNADYLAGKEEKRTVFSIAMDF